MSVFQGCVIAIAGQLSTSPFELSRLITNFGGKVAFMITSGLTHLVTSPDEVESDSSKVRAARKLRCFIVKEEYITACIHAGRRLDETRFLLAQREELVVAPRRDITISKDSMSTSSGGLGEMASISSSFSPQRQGNLPTAWKVREVRVFVSSTFRDMTSEREALVTNTFPRLKASCAERNILFGSVDLRWGITAEETLGGRALATCLYEIDQCRPYFIGLLGERYGWVAGSSKDDVFEKNIKLAANIYPWVEQFKDRSITELEMLHGALMVPDGASNRAYFYLRDPEVISSLPSKQQSDYAEIPKSESSRKLKELKDDIRRSQRNVREGFQSAEELSKQVYNDLMQAISEDFVDEKKSKVNKDDCVHQGFAASRARVYVKNQDLAHQLRNFIYSETDNITIISGPRGVGKSAVLANFWIDLLIEQERLGTLGDNTLLQAHFTCAGEDTTSYKSFLRRIIRNIATFFSLPVPATISDEELLSEFRTWLSVASARGSLILIIDGLELFDTAGLAPLHWLPQEIPRNVKLFVSMDTNTASKFNRKEGVEKVTLGPLSMETKRVYVAEYLRWSGKKLSESQTMRIIESKHTESPLYIRVLLDDLLAFASFEDLDARLTTLLSCNTVPQLYERVINGWKERFSTPLVENALRLLLCSRRGLYEQELQEMLAAPQYQWSSFFLAIKDSILNSGGLYSFGDGYLKEAVQRMCGGGNDAETRRELLKYFIMAPLARKLDEVPYQLQQLSNWPALRQFVVNTQHAVAMAANNATRAELHGYWSVLKVSPEEMASLYLKETESYSEEDTVKRAESFSLLAQVLDEAGAYRAALTLHDKALDIARTNEGVDLATKLYNSGCVQTKIACSDEEYNNGEALLREAWKLFEQRGCSSADVAGVLGQVSKKRAKYSEARKFYEAALQALGVGHAVKRAELLRALGDVERKLENYKIAREHYEQALALLSDSVGSQHVFVIEVLRDLGLVAKKLAEYNIAMTHYEKALAIAEKLLGSSHPQCSLLLKEVADVQRKLGQLDAAMETYNRVLVKVKEVYKDDHPEVAEVYNNQGLVEKKRGNYAGAQTRYEKALKILVATFAGQHPKVAMVKMNLADIYRKRGAYEQAKELNQEAVEQLSAALGENHPEVAEVLNSLGLVCKKQAQYGAAEEAYDRALSIFKTSYGASHPKVGIVLNNLADVKRKQRDQESASRTYAEALRIVSSSLGQESVEAADVLVNMGLLARDQGDMSEATRLTQKALVIFERQLGSSHYKVGMAVHNLAQIAALRQETSAAEPLFERALRLLEATPPELVDVLFDYGGLLNQKRQFDRAQEIYKKGLALVEKIFGKDHPKIKAFQQQLVNSS